jgi:hypothetical protein
MIMKLLGSVDIEILVRLSRTDVDFVLYLLDKRSFLVRLSRTVPDERLFYFLMLFLASLIRWL